MQDRRHRHTKRRRWELSGEAKRTTKSQNTLQRNFLYSDSLFQTIGKHSLHHEKPPSWKVCDWRFKCALDPIVFQLKIRETQWEPRTYFKPNSSANRKNPTSSLANGSYAFAWVWFTRKGVITPHALAPSSLENLRRTTSWVGHDAEGKESSEDGKSHSLFW